MDKTEQPNHPMPSAGGSYIRNPDGSLSRNPAEAPATTATPAAEAPAESTDEPAAPARRNRNPKE